MYLKGCEETYRAGETCAEGNSEPGKWERALHVWAQFGPDSVQVTKVSKTTLSIDTAKTYNELGK